MALDSMGFVANMVSLVLYFMGVMHFDIPTSANTQTNLMGSTFLLTVLGGFISDAYLNMLVGGATGGGFETLRGDKTHCFISINPKLTITQKTQYTPSLSL